MASWNEFVLTVGPTPAIGPKAIITNDSPASFVKFSTAVMGSVPIAGHYVDGVAKSQLERGVNASDFGTDDQKVDVSKQRNVSDVAYYAIANSSQTYVDRCLLGIRAGLAYRNEMTVKGVRYDPAHNDPDTGKPYLSSGGFPAQKFGAGDSNHKLHNKWMFCEHSARSLRMIKASAFYTGATATEVDALAVQLGEVAAWTLAAVVSPQNDDYLKFYQQTGNVNQLIRVAGGLHEVGLLTGTAAYTTAAQTRLEEVFSATVQPGQTSRHVSPGGIFKEKRADQGDVEECGFDIVYQTVSLDVLCTYYMSLSAGAWKDTVYGFIARGVARWLHVLNSSSGTAGRHRTGRRSRQRPIFPVKFINDADSTRTAITTYAPGAAPVDWDRDTAGFRMHVWHYLGVSTTLGVRLDLLADQVTRYGASFGHRPNDDDGNDGF